MSLERISLHTQFINLSYWIVILQYVHEPNSHVFNGVTSFGGCEFYTLQTSLCSQIHVIVDYLSAINIYETTKISAAVFFHTILALMFAFIMYVCFHTFACFFSV